MVSDQDSPSTLSCLRNPILFDTPPNPPPIAPGALPTPSCPTAPMVPILPLPKAFASPCPNRPILVPFDSGSLLLGLARRDELELGSAPPPPVAAFEGLTRLRVGMVGWTDVASSCWSALCPTWGDRPDEARTTPVAQKQDRPFSPRPSAPSARPA